MYLPTAITSGTSILIVSVRFTRTPIFSSKLATTMVTAGWEMLPTITIIGIGSISICITIEPGTS